MQIYSAIAQILALPLQNKIITKGEVCGVPHLQVMSHASEKWIKYHPKRQLCTAIK
jgi:hypothetical protein